MTTWTAEELDEYFGDDFDARRRAMEDARADAAFRNSAEVESGDGEEFDEYGESAYWDWRSVADGL